MSSRTVFVTERRSWLSDESRWPYYLGRVHVDPQKGSWSLDRSLGDLRGEDPFEGSTTVSRGTSNKSWRSFEMEPVLIKCRLHQKFVALTTYLLSSSEHEYAGANPNQDDVYNFSRNVLRVEMIYLQKPMAKLISVNWEASFNHMPNCSCRRFLIFISISRNLVSLRESDPGSTEQTVEYITKILDIIPGVARLFKSIFFRSMYMMDSTIFWTF